MYRLVGLSVGFQFGGEATDFVVLVMNQLGPRPSSKAKLNSAPILRSRRDLKGALLRHRLRAPWKQRCSRTRAREGSLRVSHYPAQIFNPASTITRQFTGRNLPRPFGIAQAKLIDVFGRMSLLA